LNWFFTPLHVAIDRVDNDKRTSLALIEKNTVLHQLMVASNNAGLRIGFEGTLLRILKNDRWKFCDRLFSTLDKFFSDMEKSANPHMKYALHKTFLHNRKNYIDRFQKK
jgi:hypothetical protein